VVVKFVVLCLPFCRCDLTWCLANQYCQPSKVQVFDALQSFVVVVSYNILPPFQPILSSSGLQSSAGHDYPKTNDCTGGIRRQVSWRECRAICTRGCTASLLYARAAAPPVPSVGSANRRILARLHCGGRVVHFYSICPDSSRGIQVPGTITCSSSSLRMCKLRLPYFASAAGYS